MGVVTVQAADKERKGELCQSITEAGTELIGGVLDAEGCIGALEAAEEAGEALGADGVGAVGVVVWR